MKYSKPITAAIFMTALLPVSQVYASQGHAAQPDSAQSNWRQAPELFDDFGVAQPTIKVLPYLKQ